MRDFRRIWLLKHLLRWASPSYNHLEITDKDEWRRQHDEVSRTVTHTMMLLISVCLFCLLALGAPDVNLISTNAKISMPVIHTDVSYSGFLVFGPLVLIGLTFYVHVFVERLLALPPAPGQYPLPLLCNVPGRGAGMLSGLILYWMVPAILAIFTWKALPRPEAPWLVVCTSATTTMLLGLQIRRCASPRGVQPPQRAGATMATLWLLWASALALCLVQVALLLRALLLVPTDASLPAAGGPGPAAPRSTGHPAMVLPTRPLQLYHAELTQQHLTYLNLRAANLRKAVLKESDLEGTSLAYADVSMADFSGANLASVDLRHANLRGTILVGAHLKRADLREATIDDTTRIDERWHDVWRIVNKQMSVKQDWTWANLQDADLREVDLARATLIGVDLRGADLRGAIVTGADLRLADLRRTDFGKLPVNSVHLDGAITDTTYRGAPPQPHALVIAIVNRTTQTCLDSPGTLQNTALLRMADCIRDVRSQHWQVTRTTRGEIILESALGPWCLDSTSARHDGVKPHMWQCNAEYLNQHWSVEPKEDGYVLLRRATGFCLATTGRREDTHPHLWGCDRSNHDQHWTLHFSQ